MTVDLFPASSEIDRQRRNVLRAMMVITAIGGILFAGLNLHRGLWGAAAVELTFVAYSLILLPILGRTRRFRRWALAYVLPWVGAMLAILAMPGTSPSVFVWPVLLPLVLYFVLGSRLGLAVSLFSLSGAALLAWVRFGLPTDSAATTITANFMLAGLLGLALAHVYERSRERNEQRLQELAATDTLTGLPNRKLLGTAFEQYREKSTAEQPLSVLLMDLDHFKRVNDRHGHAAGDRALIEFARRVRAELRDDDFFCRFGGEEFLVLLPRTDKAGASRIAERLRHAWRGYAPAGEFSMTGQRNSVSVGVATLGPDGNDLDALLHCADRRLYRAKAEGRDRTVTE